MCNVMIFLKICSAQFLCVFYDNGWSGFHNSVWSNSIRQTNVNCIVVVTTSEATMVVDEISGFHLVTSSMLCSYRCWTLVRVNSRCTTHLSLEMLIVFPKYLSKNLKKPDGLKVLCITHNYNTSLVGIPKWGWTQCSNGSVAGFL